MADNWINIRGREGTQRYNPATGMVHTKTNHDAGGTWGAGQSLQDKIAKKEAWLNKQGDKAPQAGLDSLAHLKSLLPQPGGETGGQAAAPSPLAPPMVQQPAPSAPAPAAPTPPAGSVSAPEANAEIEAVKVAKGVEAAGGSKEEAKKAVEETVPGAGKKTAEKAVRGPSSSKGGGSGRQVARVQRERAAAEEAIRHQAEQAAKRNFEAQQAHQMALAADRTGTFEYGGQGNLGGGWGLGGSYDVDSGDVGVNVTKSFGGGRGPAQEVDFASIPVGPGGRLSDQELAAYTDPYALIGYANRPGVGVSYGDHVAAQRGYAEGKSSLGADLGKLALQGAGSYLLGGPLGGAVGQALGNHFFSGQQQQPQQSGPTMNEQGQPAYATPAEAKAAGGLSQFAQPIGQVSGTPAGYSLGSLAVGALPAMLMGGQNPMGQMMGGGAPAPGAPASGAPAPMPETGNSTADAAMQAGQVLAGGGDAQQAAGAAAGTAASAAGVPGGDLIGKAIGGGEITGGDVAKAGLQAAGTAFGGPLGGMAAGALGSALGLKDGHYQKNTKGYVDANDYRRVDRSKGVTYPKKKSIWDMFKK